MSSIYYSGNQPMLMYKSGNMAALPINQVVADHIEGLEIKAYAYDLLEKMTPLPCAGCEDLTTKVKELETEVATANDLNCKLQVKIHAHEAVATKLRDNCYSKTHMDLVREQRDSLKATITELKTEKKSLRYELRVANWHVNRTVHGHVTDYPTPQDTD